MSEFDSDDELTRKICESAAAAGLNPSDHGVSYPGRQSRDLSPEWSIRETLQRLKERGPEGTETRLPDEGRALARVREANAIAKTGTRPIFSVFFSVQAFTLLTLSFAGVISPMTAFIGVVMFSVASTLMDAK